MRVIILTVILLISSNSIAQNVTTDSVKLINNGFGLRYFIGDSLGIYQDYDSLGRLREERITKVGRLHGGHKISYFENGEVRFFAYYLNGGYLIWTMKDSSGNYLVKNGNSNGFIVHQSERYFTKFKYQNGLKTGISKRYFKPEQKFYWVFEKWKHGKLVVEKTNYVTNGNKSSKTKCRKQHCTIKKWDYFYGTDKIKRVQISHKKDGKLHGKHKVYQVNGKISVISTYKNGVREGVFKVYNKNGKLRYKARYENNVKIWEKEIRSNDSQQNIPEPCGMD